MLFKNVDIVGWGPWLKFMWKGHVTNWLWRPREERRFVRLNHYGAMKMSYFDKYIPFVRSLRAEDRIQSPYDFDDEKIYVLWFQNIENAPEIVQKCVKSICQKYPDKVIILNEETMYDYMKMPSFIIDKWKNKQIVPANYSDIVRISLLAENGGYWFDATDYLVSEIPGYIREADFFMFITSPRIYQHMFVQTCFMRAKKGDPLIRMWRDLVYEYWKREERSADYFLAHMLFKLLVTHNPEAKSLFEKMPKVYQDGIHELWFTFGNKPYSREEFKKMCDQEFFQKCSYRFLKNGVNKLEPGTIAHHLIYEGLEK